MWYRTNVACHSRGKRKGSFAGKRRRRLTRRSPKPTVCNNHGKGKAPELLLEDGWCLLGVDACDRNKTASDFSKVSMAHFEVLIEKFLRSLFSEKKRKEVRFYLLCDHQLYLSLYNTAEFSLYTPLDNPLCELDYYALLPPGVGS